MIDVPLEAGEQIKLRSLRHWVNLVPVVVSAAAMIVAAAVLAYVGGRYSKVSGIALPSGLLIAVAALLTLLAVAVYATGWWVYRRNQLILTNQHLIRVEQNGLFARKVSQLSLSKVQDVNGARDGIIATILNYGRVEVQSAGEEEEFVFTQMPRPADLAAALLKAHDDFGAGRDDGVATPSQPAPSAPLSPTPAPAAPPAAAPSAAPSAAAPEPHPASEDPVPVPTRNPQAEAESPETGIDSQSSGIRQAQPIEPPLSPERSRRESDDDTPDPQPTNERRTPSGPQPLVEGQPTDLDPPVD